MDAKGIFFWRVICCCVCLTSITTTYTLIDAIVMVLLEFSIFLCRGFLLLRMFSFDFLQNSFDGRPYYGDDRALIGFLLE